MPSEQLRFTAMNPNTGKQQTKVISLKKYSKEEAQKLGEKWKEDCKNGLIKHNRRTTIPDNVSVSSSDSDSTVDSPEKLFTFQNIDDVPVPEDKFGMSWLLLGMTRSGKSTLMIHLWEHFFKKHITVLHTGSHQSEINKPLLKSVALSPFFCSKLIKTTTKINESTKNHYKFLHIVDDIVNKKNDKQLIHALTVGRNHRNSVMITGQELSIFNAIGRSNINFVCLFKLGSDMAIEKVIKTYLRSSFPTDMKLADMIKIYKQITYNHGFFIIDNINNTIHISKLDIKKSK